MKRHKRKPAKDSTNREKTEKAGLDHLLRERKPTGGFVVLAKYSKLKSVTA